MIGRKICFYAEIWLIFPKLNLLFLLICSTDCERQISINSASLDLNKNYSPRSDCIGASLIKVYSVSIQSASFEHITAMFGHNIPFFGQ